MSEQQSASYTFEKLAERDLLAGNTLTIDIGGGSYRFGVREPWYTTIPLSAISTISVTVNGYAVPAENIMLSLRGQMIPAESCKGIFEIHWNMGEAAEIVLVDSNLSELVTVKNTVTIAMELRTVFNYGLPGNKLNISRTAEMGVQ